MDEPIKKLIGLVAYLLPYALIPLTFKFAGGLFATVAGMANDRSKGLFDRARNKRPEKYGRMRAGELPTAIGGRRLGSLTSGVASGPRGWKQGRKGMRAYREAQQTLTGQQQIESDQVWQANKNNDKFLTAHANEALAIKKRDAATGAERAAWDNAISASRLVQKTPATRLAAAQAWAATGYNLSPGSKGYQELSQTIAEITGAEVSLDDQGNATVTGAGAGAYRNAMNSAQYGLKGAGRVDLAGINDGAGYDKKAAKSGVRKLSNYQRGQGKTDLYHGAAEAWLGSGAVDTDSGKTLDATTLTSGIETSLSSGQTSDADVAEYHAMLIRDKDGASDANKLEIQKQIDAIESVQSRTGPLGEMIAQNHREYRSRGINPSEIET